MKKMPVILRTTEVIGGIKCRPGNKVELAGDDPIAVKTAAMEKAEVAAGIKHAG